MISFDAIGRLKFGPLYPSASGLPSFSACTGTSVWVIWAFHVSLLLACPSCGDSAQAQV